MLSRLLLVGFAVFAMTARVSTAGDDPKPSDPKKSDEAAAADSEAPLPEGWPGGTKPGVIEIKTYPAYRSAVARDDQSSMNNPTKLFWPLFIHIQREKIAMTAPVVMTYESKVIENPGEKGKVSMEFLYRTPDQGHAGGTDGPVKVEDRPGDTFVCIGVQGRVDEKAIVESVKKLHAWLEDHKSDWVAAGEPRRLGYHGPGTPMRRQLGEGHIPVKPATGQPEKASAPSPSK